jgi:hypothetical protein
VALVIDRPEQLMARERGANCRLIGGAHCSSESRPGGHEMSETDERVRRPEDEAVCACCADHSSPLTRLSNGMAYCHSCAQTLGRAIGRASGAGAGRGSR